jgi:hypothetical protein
MAVRAAFSASMGLLRGERGGQSVDGEVVDRAWVAAAGVVDEGGLVRPASIPALSHFPLAPPMPGYYAALSGSPRADPAASVLLDAATALDAEVSLAHVLSVSRTTAARSSRSFADGRPGACQPAGRAGSCRVQVLGTRPLGHAQPPPE